MNALYFISLWFQVFLQSSPTIISNTYLVKSESSIGGNDPIEAVDFNGILYFGINNQIYDKKPGVYGWANSTLYVPLPPPVNHIISLFVYNSNLYLIGTDNNSNYIKCQYNEVSRGWKIVIDTLIKERIGDLKLHSILYDKDSVLLHMTLKLPSAEPQKIYFGYISNKTPISFIIPDCK